MENTNEQPEPGGLVIYSRHDVWKQYRSPVNYSDIRRCRTAQSRVKNVHLVASAAFTASHSQTCLQTLRVEPVSIPAAEGGAERTQGGIL